jgi:PAS domain S-box-containing protein
VDPAYLFEQASDALIVVDRLGTVVLFNGAAADLFGYRASEIVGASLDVLIPVSARAHHHALVEGFVAERSERRLMASDRSVVEGVRKNGTTFPAAITVGPLDLGTGQPLAMAAVRDESMLVDMNLRLKSLSEELETRNEELQQFLLSASHDLREPLRKVRTFSEQLSEALPDDLDEWSQLCLDRTIDAGERMWVLLDELIGYTRLTFAERTGDECVLDEIIQEAAEDLSLRISQTGTVIEVAALPSVVGDRVLLRQLFHNLLSNSIKFAREDEPPRVRVSAGASEADMVVIDFDDNGIGVESGYEERAFEPFRRVHRDPAVEGSGMGLTICRKVARLHGGDVRISPNPAGPGTRMRVSLARRPG